MTPDPFDFVRCLRSDIGEAAWNWSPEVKGTCECGSNWAYHNLYNPHECLECEECKGYRPMANGLSPLDERTGRLYKRWSESIGYGGLFDDCFLAINKAYNEPGRVYHTLQHLEQCFDVMDRLVPYKAGSDKNHEHTVLSLAIWYHDITYNQLGKDNEQQSVDVFETWAEVLDWDRSVRDEVSRAILLTKHDDSLEVGTEAEAYLLDVDLSILGAAPDAFAEYERRIREEYRMVPDEHYYPARLKVLERFAAKQSVYLTKPFRDAYEEQAKVNLRNAIAHCVEWMGK